jgi:hypothetical protein
MDVIVEHGFEVTSSKDERTAEAFASDGAHRALADAFVRGAGPASW